MPKAKKDRRVNDAYMTPQACANACAKTVEELRTALGLKTFTVLEPSCGEGAFVRASQKVLDADVYSVDIDPKFNPSVCSDFLKLESEGSFDVIIGNPPYLKAAEFVRHAMPMLDQNGTLAFLLRSTWQGSALRRDWLLEEGRPSFSVRLFPRPSFTGDGKTDGSEYDLVIWQLGCAERVPYLRWA